MYAFRFLLHSWPAELTYNADKGISKVAKQLGIDFAEAIVSGVSQGTPKGP